MRGIAARSVSRLVVSNRHVLVELVFVAVMLPAVLMGLAGCTAGGEEGVTTTTYAATETTAAGAAVESIQDQGAPSATDGSAEWEDGSGSLVALEGTAGQKVISDAQMEIEVGGGEFETTFEQALLLADRYGGYVISSSAYAGGDEQDMQSGVIAIRVPASAFSRALSDAAKLGEVRNRQIQTQDVTEEYVDLEARIANSEAHVQALLALLAKADTVDDILRVQQVLTGAQQQLEELKGRLRYLEEHTSYATLTLSIYEAGAVIAETSEWGFTGALKDAVRNLVRAVNAIVRALGVLVPVVIVLAIIAYVVYRTWRYASRRRREREAARYQPRPEGWGGVGNVQPTSVQPVPSASSPNVDQTLSGPTATGPSEGGPESQS